MVERRTFADRSCKFGHEPGTIGATALTRTCSATREDVPLTGRRLRDG